MTDTSNGAPQDSVAASIAALEMRIVELENVVHALGTSAYYAEHGHGVILPWLEKIGARIKSAVEKVV